MRARVAGDVAADYPAIGAAYRQGENIMRKFLTMVIVGMLASTTLVNSASAARGRGNMDGGNQILTAGGAGSAAGAERALGATRPKLSLLYRSRPPRRGSR